MDIFAGQYLLEWAAIFGDYGISHQLVADSGQNSVFCSVLCNGYFYKKILEKYVDRIPSVVYFAIVFAAKLMIFLHYKTRLAYTPAWCNDFNQGPVMPIIIGFWELHFGCGLQR